MSSLEVERGPSAQRSVHCSVDQSCLTLWNSMDCSLPGFSVHPGKNTGVVALSSSRGSSRPWRCRASCTWGAPGQRRRCGKDKEVRESKIRSKADESRVWEGEIGVQLER